MDRGRLQLYEVFGIASKSEIQKLSRKLNTLSKKLSEFTREQVVEEPEPEPEDERQAEQESALG